MQGQVSCVSVAEDHLLWSEVESHCFSPLGSTRTPTTSEYVPISSVVPLNRMVAFRAKQKAKKKIMVRARVHSNTLHCTAARLSGAKALAKQVHCALQPRSRIVAVSIFIPSFLPSFLITFPHELSAHPHIVAFASFALLPSSQNPS